MTVLIDRKKIEVAYREAKSRILFLDYDGTLVPFNDRPEDSELGQETRKVLLDLTNCRWNDIYIISGRDKRFLTEEFRDLRVGLVAEHGFFLKVDGRDWITTAVTDMVWKKEILNMFSGFADRFPRSFLEEKEASVAYHYRSAEPGSVNSIRPAVRKQFNLLKQRYPGLELLDGDNILEIKPGSYNKGSVASTLVMKGSYDFILAAGDDMTDEELFSGLPPGSFTIKIGNPPSIARYCIPFQEQFLEFLAELERTDECRANGKSGSYGSPCSQ